MLRFPILCALFGAGLLLTAIAWSRGAEYDEQYTLFLTGSVARPLWPETPLTAGDVQVLQAAHASFTTIASDLRATDVHPPLYFWIVEIWRRLAGNGLFAARMASVLFSVVTLGLVAVIARSTGIPALPAVLLTLGCYGFAYTGTIGRGFALAQMLSVAGIALVVAARGRRGCMIAAGMLLGAATFANYLAAFTAFAALLHTVIRSAALRVRRRLHPSWPGLFHAPKEGVDGRAKPGHDDGRRFCAILAAPMLPIPAMTIGMAVWLPADAWFFLAQRQSRTDQFAPFEPLSAMARLAQYAAATVFGGLPLYVADGARMAVTSALALILLALIVIVVRRWKQIATPAIRPLLAMAATAPPTGLILLGLAFHNTPIELRYLAFATPFIGLILAAALPRSIRHAVLLIQAMALIGLMTRAETMQPARATAIAAAALERNGVVLLPHGNDGVGIVGAFAVEAPADLRILVIREGESAEQIRARVDPYSRVVLALFAQDDASRATLPAMRQAFTDPCWRPAARGPYVLTFDRICGVHVH